MTLSEEELAGLRQRLQCNFAQIDEVFPHLLVGARSHLSAAGLEAWLEGASLICMIGRGVEPVLVYLEEMPEVAGQLGETVLERVAQAVWKLSRSPNGRAIPPFLQVMAEVARRLRTCERLAQYMELIFDMMERTTGSIHGFHATQPSPGLPHLLRNMPFLLSQLSLDGLRNWVDYGIRHYSHHPQRQEAYFSLELADSRAMLHKERQGCLLQDHERALGQYLQAFWQQDAWLVPYSETLDAQTHPKPYFDEAGMRVPDVYTDLDGVAGLDRYRALLAHMAAHRRWSGRVVADNYSPLQRMAIEVLEDSRVEWLAMQQWPGLRQLWRHLHPRPAEDACDELRYACVRHRLAMLSWALLNPEDHGYRHEEIRRTVAAFQQAMQADNSTQAMVRLALTFVARTRVQADQQASVWFEDTEVSYRDDNRHLWLFIEEGDEEEAFDKKKREVSPEEAERLPPRLYPEWDHQSQAYLPDWASVYEILHPPGDASRIDRLLERHAALAKRMKRVLDLLKPQDHVRVRFQEEGSELDLDIALRSLIDYRCKVQPDPRINFRMEHNHRDIAVTLLLDLSESLNETVPGGEQTLLELNQEATALLAWAIEQLGDRLAIAGFHSNTRHEIRYLHIKGFGEAWDDTVKARLAAMEAGWSTRMGAALRHAGSLLAKRREEKRLLLVVTDGEPSDVDVQDEDHLLQDARKAVQELSQQNIHVHCISLDPNADEYMQTLFGRQYLVIDRVERLPEKLPQLFLSLTR